YKSPQLVVSCRTHFHGLWQQKGILILLALHLRCVSLTTAVGAEATGRKDHSFTFRAYLSLKTVTFSFGSPQNRNCHNSTCLLVYLSRLLTCALQMCIAGQRFSPALINSNCSSCKSPPRTTHGQNHA